MSWSELLMVLAGGTLAALVLRRLRLPMWPITGGVVGAAVVHLVFDGPSQMPGFVSPAAQVLVGSAIGTMIGRSIFQEFVRIITPGTIAVLVVVSAGVGLGLVLSILDLLHPTVAVLGMVPGGVGEMVAAAITLHADSATVAGLHLIRLLVVIWSLPLLVRLARRLGRGSPGEPTE